MADAASGSASEEINVKVKTMQPATYELRVPVQITVGELKQRLVDQSSIPQDRQRIIYKGRVLDNDQRLQAHGVQEGHTLHLVQRATDAPPPAAAHASQHTGQLPAGLGIPIAMGSLEVDSDETDVNSLLNSIFRQLGGQGQMPNPAPGDAGNAADQQRTGQEAQFIAQQLMESLGGQMGPDAMQGMGAGPMDGRPNMLASIQAYLNRLQQEPTPTILLPSLSYPPGQESERREQTRLMDAVRGILTPAVQSRLSSRHLAFLDAALARNAPPPASGSAARSDAASQPTGPQTSAPAHPAPNQSATSQQATPQQNAAAPAQGAATDPPTATAGTFQTPAEALQSSSGETQQSPSGSSTANIARPNGASTQQTSANAGQSTSGSTQQNPSDQPSTAENAAAGRNGEGARRRRATGRPAISPAVTMALGQLLIAAQESSAWRESNMRPAAELLLRTDTFEGDHRQQVLDLLRNIGSRLYRIAPVQLELARACSAAVAAMQGDAGPLALNGSQYIRPDGSRPAIGYTPPNVHQVVSSMSIPLFPGMPMGAMPMGPGGPGPTMAGPAPSPAPATNGPTNAPPPGGRRGAGPASGPGAAPAGQAGGQGGDRGAQPGSAPQGPQPMGFNVGALLQSAFANAAANAGAQGNRPGVIAGESRQVIQVPGAPPVTIRFGARPGATQAPAAAPQGAANTPISLQIGSGTPVDLSPVIQQLGTMLSNAVQSAVYSDPSASGTAATAPAAAASAAPTPGRPAGGNPAGTGAPGGAPSAATLLNPPVMQQLLRALLHSISPFVNSQAAAQPSGGGAAPAPAPATATAAASAPASNLSGSSDAGASAGNSAAARTGGQRQSTGPSAAATPGSAAGPSSSSGAARPPRGSQLGLSEPLVAAMGTFDTALRDAMDNGLLENLDIVPQAPTSTQPASGQAPTVPVSDAQASATAPQQSSANAQSESEPSAPPTAPTAVGASSSGGQRARGLGSAALPPRDKASKKAHSRASSPGASNASSSGRQSPSSRPAPSQPQQDNVKRARHGRSPPQSPAAATAAGSAAAAVAHPSSDQAVEEIAQPSRGAVQARNPGGGLEEIMSSMFGGGADGGEGLNLGGLMQAAGQAMQDPQNSQRMARVFQGMAQGGGNRQGQGQVANGPQSSPSDSAAGGGGLGAILGSLMQSLNVGSPGQSQGASLQTRGGAGDASTAASSIDWQSVLSELDEEERAEWERTIREDLARQAEVGPERHKDHSAAYLAGRPPQPSSMLLPSDSAPTAGNSST